MAPPGQLNHLYWSLRQNRPGMRPGRRTLYRRIEAEKKRLLVTGVPRIELHLWCRYLINPDNNAAAARLGAYLRGETLRY